MEFHCHRCDVVREVDILSSSGQRPEDPRITELLLGLAPCPVCQRRPRAARFWIENVVVLTALAAAAWGLASAIERVIHARTPALVIAAMAFLVSVGIPGYVRWVAWSTAPHRVRFANKKRRKKTKKTSAPEERPVAELSKAEEKRRGEAEGRLEAKKDLQAGTARRLVFGSRLGEGLLDPATGLRRASLGSVFTGELHGFLTGYNDEVDQALARGEATSSLFLHKVTTRAALEERFRREEAIVVAEGPPVVIAGVRIEASRRKTFLEEWVVDLRVFDVVTNERKLIECVSEQTRILFDHDDTTLVVWETDRSVFTTHDIPDGFRLQRFGPDDSPG